MPLDQNKIKYYNRSVRSTKPRRPVHIKVERYPNVTVDIVAGDVYYNRRIITKHKDDDGVYYVKLRDYDDRGNAFFFEVPVAEIIWEAKNKTSINIHDLEFIHNPDNCCISNLDEKELEDSVSYYDMIKYTYDMIEDLDLPNDVKEFYSLQYY